MTKSPTTNSNSNGRSENEKNGSLQYPTSLVYDSKPVDARMFYQSLSQALSSFSLLSARREKGREMVAVLRGKIVDYYKHDIKKFNNFIKTPKQSRTEYKTFEKFPFHIIYGLKKYFLYLLQLCASVR